MALPLTVCMPFKVKAELLRSMVIPLPIPGAKERLPEAVAPPLREVNPVTPKVEERVVAPVTPSVVLTDALFNVAKPEVPKVLSEVLPVTPRVDERLAAPVTPRVP